MVTGVGDDLLLDGLDAAQREALDSRRLPRPAPARRALVGDELRALKVDHHAGVTISLPAVRHDVTSGFVQWLFYFSKSGRFGPRQISSSRRLYRKKPDKLG